MPFEPEAGRARWRAAYDLFSSTPTGTVITYPELADTMGLDVKAGYDRRSMWSAAGTAARRLAAERGRTAVAVRGVGYRIEALDAAAMTVPFEEAVRDAYDAFVPLVGALSRALAIMAAYIEAASPEVPKEEGDPQ